ncbi:hypothetical protein BDR03DRAFT_982005 [Suillus americanus]|nr:hypothetical protein BDR03DRAFT_982005 [Suillus americanus]
MIAGEALRAKYKNSDLPPGCLDQNLWHGVFIPTVAHAAGGENVHPWSIEDNVLIQILTKAWNIVYADNPSLMKYQIVPGGAIYHVVKQRLSEWHGGLGSAAVMIIMSLMASDTTYETDQEHTEFAMAFTHHPDFQTTVPWILAGTSLLGCILSSLLV